MRTLSLAFKFVGYALLVVVTAPFAWWLRHPDYDGAVFAEYDDDDLGEDVDD